LNLLLGDNLNFNLNEYNIAKQTLLTPNWQKNCLQNSLKVFVTILEVTGVKAMFDTNSNELFFVDVSAHSKIMNRNTFVIKMI
jgi:hypothetical protein